MTRAERQARRQRLHDTLLAHPDLSNREIGEMVGCSTSQAWEYRHYDLQWPKPKYTPVPKSVPVPRPQVPDDTVEMIVAGLREGFTQREIAQSVRCSESTVSKVAKARGLSWGRGKHHAMGTTGRTELDALEIGQFVAYPIQDRQTVASSASYRKKRDGKIFHTEALGDVVRVWREY